MSLYLVHSKSAQMLLSFHSLQNPTCFSKYKKFPFESDPVVKPNPRPETG